MVLRLGVTLKSQNLPPSSHRGRLFYVYGFAMRLFIRVQSKALIK